MIHEHATWVIRRREWTAIYFREENELTEERSGDVLNRFNQIVLESRVSLSIGTTCFVALYPCSELSPFSGY